MDLCLRKRLLIKKPDIRDLENVLWFHCASVGEFNTALPIIKELKKFYSIVLTYFSPRAREYLEKKANFYDLLFPLPLDFPFLVRRFESLIKPKALLVMEREMWPSLIKFTRTKKILLNAYSTGGLMERLLIKEFDLVIARTQKDREIFLEEGAKKVIACGNLKVVQEIGEVKPPDVPEGCRIFVAGSTREGEEEVILRAFTELKEDFPIRFVIAPRHISRAEEVVRLARGMGFKVSKMSEKNHDWEVLVVDTLGELKSFYSVADVAFVGGTMAKVGGHNLLEPAVFGKPVLFGPNTWKVRDLEEILLKKGYGFKVRDYMDMVSAVRKILSEGFQPKESLIEYSNKVKKCYLSGLRSELEQVHDKFLEGG